MKLKNISCTWGLNVENFPSKQRQYYIVNCMHHVLTLAAVRMRKLQHNFEYLTPYIHSARYVAAAKMCRRRDNGN